MKGVVAAAMLEAIGKSVSVDRNPPRTPFKLVACLHYGRGGAGAINRCVAQKLSLATASPYSLRRACLGVTFCGSSGLYVITSKIWVC